MDFRFKVGDRVRTLNNYDGNGNEVLFEIGTEGTITHIIQEKTDKPYKVEANGDYWYYSDDMLELIKEKVDKTKFFANRLKVFKLVGEVIEETEGDNELLKDIVYYIECYRKREHLK